MSDSRRRSQYNAQMHLGPASHRNNASHNNSSAVPPGTNSDPRTFHGSGSQGYNQMVDLLGTSDPFPINQEQDYSTERGLSHLHQREDEIDLPAAAPNSLSHFQGSPGQDSFANNVEGYLQRPTAPAWNPAIAAQQSPTTLGNTLQQIQLGVHRLTPPRQQLHMISDEGYYTYQRSQQDTRSERSNRSNSFTQLMNRPRAIPRSIPDKQRVGGLSPGRVGDYSMDSQQTPTRGGAKSDAGSNVRAVPCDEEGCSVLSKTLSDHKKHVARHKLEHVCVRDNCPRNKLGFATINDLNRHMSTVHKVRLKGTRIYRCLAKGCSKPDKDWPRKDNFQSHLRKAHPEEDVQDLTRQSEEAWDRQHQGSVGATGRNISMCSAPSVTEHTRRQSRPEMYLSSPSASDAGYAQRNVVSHTRSSHHLYVPVNVPYASRPMPDTPQFDEWEDGMRRQQLAATAGYQPGNSGFMHPRSSGVSSDDLPYSSSVTLPEQHSSRMYRAAVANPPVTYARTELLTDHDQTDDWEGPLNSMPVVGYSFMSRTASFHQPALQVPTPSHAAEPRPQTIADFRALQEDRQDEMIGFPAYQSFQDPVDNEYSGGGDMQSGVRYVGDMFNTPFAEDAITPEVIVQPPEQVATDQTSEDDSGDVNVSRLKEFLEPFTAKADNDPTKREMKNVLTHALLSLESTAGDASSAASNGGVNTDQYIEEYPNASKKIVFRCKWHKCNSTKKEWGLRSEIKKHMKRHSKPYGCTYDKCYRQFGSKSDWVRHERNRHTLAESWRCMLTKPRVAPLIQPCRRLFSTRQQFVAHLSDVHKLTRENQPDDFTCQLTEQHINANFQPQFWCGFHKEILRLTKKGKEGIHERYNHIAEHITGEGRCMDDWIPAHGILSRGHLRAKLPPKQGQPIPKDDYDDDERNDDVSPPVSTSEESTSSNDNDTLPSPFRGTFMKEPPAAQRRQQVERLQLPPTAHAGQKRTASAAGLPHSGQRAPQRRANYWRCHACQYQNLLATSAACTSMGCSHERCPLCTPMYQRSQDEQ